MYETERRRRDYYERVAPFYDWSDRLAALLRGISDAGERRQAIRRLDLEPSHRVLEVSAGTGTNLLLMAEQVGPEGRLVGLDISPAMIARCRRKLRRRRVKADIVQGEAAHLPFADSAFDAVLHHGGIAEFGDRQGAIAEMVRVARPGAKVVICDPGIPTDRKPPFVGRLFLRFQPLYAKHPPMELIPAQAEDVRLDWFHGGGWYMIDFLKPGP